MIDVSKFTTYSKRNLMFSVDIMKLLERDE